MQTDISSLPIRDIHLPGPVSWWPPAPGWWLLLALLLTIVTWRVWVVKRRRWVSLRNAARTELDALYQLYLKQYDARRFASELSVLLRRICISYFPESDTAGLTSAHWLAFLDSRLSPRHNKSGLTFSSGVGAVLLKAPYQQKLKSGDIDVEALYRLSGEWIASLQPTRHTEPSAGDGRKEAAHVSV